MNILLKIVLEFFKTGLFAVGGGLATIPFLMDMQERLGWFTSENLSTMIAVSESTPGPIGINMSTYVGSHIAGFLGAIVATLSLVTPSVLIIFIVANMLEKFKESKLIKNIFAGLKPSVLGLILSASISIFASALFAKEDFSKLKVEALLLLIGLWLVQYKYKKIHPIFLIVIGGIVGYIFKF